MNAKNKDEPKNKDNLKNPVKKRMFWLHNKKPGALKKSLPFIIHLLYG